MVSKKKQTVESPSSGKKSLVQQPTGDYELASGFDSIFEDFRRSLDNLMAPFLPMKTYFPKTLSSLPTRAPLVDLIEESDQYIVKAELPGYDKEDLNIELNKDLLIINAEKKEEKEEESENYLHRERAYASCQRTINFPKEVDPLEVEGSMKNGVLELKIPLKEPKPEEKMVKVEIK
ncbi:MAG: Hsp20/alpha crystallin family protein [Methanobacteriaceae archaeon]|nr:Hsp20/alpha crystallin family protein [Methanobacteriaceae archaeon]